MMLRKKNTGTLSIKNLSWKNNRDCPTKNIKNTKGHGKQTKGDRKYKENVETDRVG